MNACFNYYPAGAKSDGGDGNTEINFLFLTGDEAGKSVTQVYPLQT